MRDGSQDANGSQDASKYLFFSRTTAHAAGFFRDVVFMFKMLMVPSSEALPEIFSWLPLDAALGWRYQPDVGFIVTGFQRRLNPAAIQKQAEQGEDSWVSRGFRRILGIAEKPRAPPSSADPTALLRAETGTDQRIDSEEDVLHLKQAKG